MENEVIDFVHDEFLVTFDLFDDFLKRSEVSGKKVSKQNEKSNGETSEGAELAEEDKEGLGRV